MVNTWMQFSQALLKVSSSKQKGRLISCARLARIVGSVPAEGEYRKSTFGTDGCYGIAGFLQDRVPLSY